MKILILTGKLNSHLLGAKIKSIALSKKVSAIVVIHETGGPPLSKVKYHVLPRYFRGSSCRKIFARLILTFYCVIKYKPRLIVGIFSLPHGLLAFLYGKLFRIPIIIGVIGGSRELRTFCFKSKFWKRLICFCLRRTNAIVTTGPKTKECLVECGIDKNNIHILSSLIDTSVFFPEKCQKKYEIISIGSFEERKGFDRTLKIISLLKQKGIYIKAAFLGKGELKETLEKLAEDLSISENVDFLGFRERTYKFTNMSKLFVLPSDHEGLSLAMMESMATGVPPVVSDVGDTSDLVVDWQNGVLIEDYKDVESFANAIEKLLKDKKMLAELSNNALKTIRKRKTLEHGTVIWETIFKRLGF